MKEPVVYLIEKVFGTNGWRVYVKGMSTAEFYGKDAKHYARCHAEKLNMLEVVRLMKPKGKP